MSVKPSRPDDNKVRAVVKVCVQGTSVIYRYTSVKAAFAACEALSNGMFQVASGQPHIPLIKGTVLLDRIREDKDGKVITEIVEVVTSTIKLQDISFVAVVCPCCGQQIFDKIRPFHDACEHDETDEEAEIDEPPDEKPGPKDAGFYDGDDWKEGNRGR